jgi:hypothetical protein
MVLTSGSGQSVGEEVLSSGAHLSAGKLGRGYRFGGALMLGHGLVSLMGQFGSLGPFSIYSFLFLFFFCFLISFITFANLVQIASNQLCKVSKIQNNNPEQ